MLYNHSSADLEIVCKKLRSSIKGIDFNITIEPGLKRTNFLDITLDLTKDIYEPYRKSNETTSYINSQSNHHIHIKKALPIMVNNRINGLS